MAELEKRIIDKLNSFGLDNKRIGFHYIKSGVTQLCLYPKRYSAAITKYLYPEIANYYQTSAGNVEEAIRYSIRQLPNGYKSLTNSEFLLKISSEI